MCLHYELSIFGIFHRFTNTIATKKTLSSLLKLTVHVFILGWVAICAKVLRAGLVYRSDVFKSHSYMAWILFVPIEIPPDVLHEKSIYSRSAFFRPVVCLQYFLLMTLSCNSKDSFLYFSSVPFQESQRPRSTRAVSPNQTIPVCSCK